MRLHESVLEGDGGGGMSNDALRVCFAHFHISKQGKSQLFKATRHGDDGSTAFASCQTQTL